MRHSGPWQCLDFSTSGCRASFHHRLGQAPMKGEAWRPTTAPPNQRCLTSVCPQSASSWREGTLLRELSWRCEPLLASTSSPGAEPQTLLPSSLCPSQDTECGGTHKFIAAFVHVILQVAAAIIGGQDGTQFPIARKMEAVVCGEHQQPCDVAPADFLLRRRWWVACLGFPSGALAATRRGEVKLLQNPRVRRLRGWRCAAPLWGVPGQEDPGQDPIGGQLLKSGPPHLAQIPAPRGTPEMSVG